MSSSVERRPLETKDTYPNTFPHKYSSYRICMVMRVSLQNPGSCCSIFDAASEAKLPWVTPFKNEKYLPEYLLSCEVVTEFIWFQGSTSKTIGLNCCLLLQIIIQSENKRKDEWKRKKKKIKIDKNSFCQQLRCKFLKSQQCLQSL